MKRILLLIFLIIFNLAAIELILRVTYPLYQNYNTEMFRYTIKLKSYPDTGKCHSHLLNKEVNLFGANIKTNSFGLRANKDYPLDKPDNLTRIIVLGDSITLGWGIEINSTYPYLLERLLENKTNVEVINAGIGNYNTLCEKKLLEDLMILKPDIVILGFFINDIEEVTYPNKFIYFFEKNSYIYAVAFDLYERMYMKDDYKSYYLSQYNDLKKYENLKKNLLEIINISNNSNTTLIFVNIPFLYDFENYPFLEIDEKINKEILANSNVSYLNTLNEFRNKLPDELWVGNSDIHPNPYANRIIAESIYKFMINKSVI